MLEQNSQSSSVKIIRIIVAIVIFGVIVIGFGGGYFQQGYQFIKSKISSEDKQLITYYQWSDKNGQVVISRSKPKLVEDYITFQGSADLMVTNYDIDPELIEKGNKYRSQLESKNRPSIQQSTQAFEQSIESIEKNLAKIEQSEYCDDLANQVEQLEDQTKDRQSYQSLDSIKEELRDLRYEYYKACRDKLAR